MEASAPFVHSINYTMTHVSQKASTRDLKIDNQPVYKLYLNKTDHKKKSLTPEHGDSIMTPLLPDCDKVQESSLSGLRAFPLAVLTVRSTIIQIATGPVPLEGTVKIV